MLDHSRSTRSRAAARQDASLHLDVLTLRRRNLNADARRTVSLLTRMAAHANAAAEAVPRNDIDPEFRLS